MGCGTVGPRPGLFRLALAAPDGPGARGVVADRTGTLPGRGSYLCAASDGAPAPACLALALRRGGLQRGFRQAVTVPREFVDSVS